MKKRILALFLCVLVCFCASAFFGCNKQEEPQTVKTFFKACDSPDGYASVRIPSDGSLDVLILADPQVDTSEKYSVIGASNEKTYTFIKEIVSAAKPDLVLVAGDLVMSTVQSNQRWLLRYADVLEAAGVPWSIVFGNHDSENSWTDKEQANAEFPDDPYEEFWGQITKARSVELLSAYDHCLLSAGDCEDGVGNYFINVKDASDNIAYTICCFDTVYEDSTEYSHVATAAQINWYVQNVNAISDLRYGTDRAATQVVHSSVVQHVGLPEFKTAWNAAWNNGNPTSDYFYGHWTDGNYSSYISNTDFLETAVATGSLDAVFFGHHHDNDFSVSYKGVRLTSVQHSGMSHTYRVNRVDDTFKKWDFTAYDKYGDQRGGTMLSVKADGATAIAPVYATEIMPDAYAALAIDYEALATTLTAKGHTVIRWTEE